MTLEVTAQVRVGEFELQCSFVVGPGITVLKGPSGAGKTTVLKVVAGLVRGNGLVRLASDTWEGAGVFVVPEARRVGFVFQSLALFPHLTALENVRFGEVDEPTAVRWLGRLGVEALAHRKPASFSGGEAQRVALARALARGPRVLLLDEPFTSLDPALREQLQREVQSVVAELGIPALLVTHDEVEAASLARQTLRLAKGRLVAA
jgi:molybdate transport system ATP-binding protein